MEKHYTPQDCPIDAENLIAPRLMATQKTDVFMFLRDNFSDLFRAEDHEGLYKNQKRGRNNKEPEMLSGVILLQYLTKTSDIEAIGCLNFDIRWKNVFRFGVDTAAPFDRTTLVKYRARLLAAGKTDIIFQRGIDLCCEKGMVDDSEKQRIAADSTAIFGAGCVKDTYNLLATGLTKILRTMAREADLSVEEMAKKLDLSYDPAKSIKGQMDLDWTDPVETAGALEKVVAMLTEAKEKFEQGGYAADFSFIDSIIEQDVEHDPQTGGHKLIDGVAEDRIISASDQEMRHGRKSASNLFNGFKVHIATSGDHGVITAVSVVPGNEHDGKGLKEIVEQAEKRTEAKVDEILVDNGYSTTENLDWLDKSEGRSVDNLICKPRHLSNNGLFTKVDFKIDLEAKTVTCPAGKSVPIPLPTLGAESIGAGKRAVVKFPAKMCHSCKKKKKCLRKGARQGRSISIHAYERHQREQRERYETPEWREYLRWRTKAEHAIAKLIAYGLRKARYFGVRRVLLQAQFTAAAVNIRKLVSIK